MLRRYLIFVLLLLSPTVIASTESETIKSSKADVYGQNKELLNSVTIELEQIKTKIAESNEGVDNSIIKVNKRADIQAEELNKKLESVEIQLNDYHKELETLRVEAVNDSLGMNFSIWTGILLASVAVLVTILGVVIAIGSVFGYKKIMDSTRKEAERIAKEEANKVARNEVAQRIDRGEFNALVIEAVDRVAFGNINSNVEFDSRRDD